MSNTVLSEGILFHSLYSTSLTFHFIQQPVLALSSTTRRKMNRTKAEDFKIAFKYKGEFNGVANTKVIAAKLEDISMNNNLSAKLQKQLEQIFVTINTEMSGEESLLTAIEYVAFTLFL